MNTSKWRTHAHKKAGHGTKSKAAGCSLYFRGTKRKTKNKR